MPLPSDIAPRKGDRKRKVLPPAKRKALVRRRLNDRRYMDSTSREGRKRNYVPDIA